MLPLNGRDHTCIQNLYKFRIPKKPEMIISFFWNYQSFSTDTKLAQSRFSLNFMFYQDYFLPEIIKKNQTYHINFVHYSQLR